MPPIAKDGLLVCNACALPKERSEFHKRGYKCKDCMKERNKRYYAENQAQLLERQKNRDAQNRESKRNYNRSYFIANKEAMQESNKLWRRNNPEKAQAITRRHHEQHRENAARRKRKRLSLKVSAPGEGASLTQLASVWGWPCYLCGDALAEEVDHVRPLSRGGTNYPENLRPICSPCNRRKNNKMLSEYLYEDGQQGFTP